jgi:hypothetical protein
MWNVWATLGLFYQVVEMGNVLPETQFIKVKIDIDLQIKEGGDENLLTAPKLLD